VTGEATTTGNMFHQSTKNISYFCLNVLVSKLILQNNRKQYYI
jgi:hypothetical protein